MLDDQTVTAKATSIIKPDGVTRSYKMVVINDNVWEYLTSERTPDYEYAGQWYEGD